MKNASAASSIAVSLERWPKSAGPLAKAAATMERVARVYWWPGVASSGKSFVDECKECRACKDPKAGTRVPLQPLQAEAVPNARCHIDLLRPMKTPNEGKRFIFVMTDGFTKYAEIVAIPDKSAKTVAEVFLKRWVLEIDSHPKQ